MVTKEEEEIGFSEAALNWLELLGSIPRWGLVLLVVIFVVSLTTVIVR